MIYYEIYTLEKRLGPPLYAISYTVYINSTVSSNIKKKNYSTHLLRPAGIAYIHGYKFYFSCPYNIQCYFHLPQIF